MEDRLAAIGRGKAGAPFCHVPKPGLQSLQAFDMQCFGKQGLGRKELIERTDGGICLGRNLRHRCRLIALARENLCGRLQQYDDAIMTALPLRRARLQFFT